MTEPVVSAVTVGAAVSVVTVGAAVVDAAARLRSAGVQTPRLDAELLLADVLGVGRGKLVVAAGEPVEGDALARFEALVDRRAAREPVAYILGRRAFRNIELSVDRRVLIPRPESELLVEVGLDLPGGARVVDVGTGSGAVALALKQERPDVEVVGTDVDAGALAVARANAVRLGLDVRFERADLLQGLQGPFEAVLANLPYVAEGEVLAPEITLYEPPEALYAGRDGLDLIRRLVGQAGGVPMAALEVGFDQADAVAKLIEDHGFGAIERLADLAGYERVVVGRR